MCREGCRQTYGNAVVVLLANALSLGLALLERVLVLELGAHVGGGKFTVVWLWVVRLQWVVAESGASGVAWERLCRRDGVGRCVRAPRQQRAGRKRPCDKYRLRNVPWKGHQPATSLYWQVHSGARHIERPS